MVDNNNFINECWKFLQKSIGDRFLRVDNTAIYDDLLIGFQKVDHPIFDKIAEIIPEHLKPLDFLPEFQMDNSVGKIGLSVISFSFVFNQKTVEENSLQNDYPSFSWYKSTDLFTEFITTFRQFLKKYCDNEQIHYVVPNTIKDKYRIIWRDGIKYSTWSERHIAYACGLGSFGLHGSLITDNGCAHRLMSVIIDKEFKYYNEPDQPWNKNCLSANNINCGKCINKCPVNSIRISGRSIINCLKHESIENKETSKRIFGYEMEACGLCMSGVPCSTKNPMKELNYKTGNISYNHSI
jgi:epoxyqueuosine reductase QueG